jgi:hypothetical protein
VQANRLFVLWRWPLWPLQFSSPAWTRLLTNADARPNHAQVDPVVFNMLSEDPGKVDYSSIGGLSEQIRELRESIELPLMNPELFLRVGIKPPKGAFMKRGCLFGWGPEWAGGQSLQAPSRNRSRMQHAFKCVECVSFYWACC